MPNHHPRPAPRNLNAEIEFEIHEREPDQHNQDAEQTTTHTSR